MARGVLLAAGALLAIAASACTQGKCGSGTVRYGDTCVLADPFDKTPPKLTVTPPIYTRSVGTVTITSDKPATIYYTIDGSPASTASPSAPDEVVIANVPDNAELHAFAIDLNGNASAELDRFWVIDREGPASPLDFHLVLAPDGATRTVTWSMAPDPRPGGVVVARVDGRMAGIPQAGTPYAVGATIAPNVTVVAVSTKPSDTFTESMPAAVGLVRYVAWGYDDLYNYGPPTGDYAVVAMPAQSTTIAVDASTTAVAISTPPTHLTLTGTSTFVAASSTLTVRLSLRNDTTRTIFAPRLVLTTALPTGGPTWTDPDGTLGPATPPQPFRGFGAAIAPGQTTAETLTFGNATATTKLTLGFAIPEGHAITGSTESTGSTPAAPIFDEDSGALLLQLSPGVTGPNGGQGITSGGITPDGLLVAGMRSAGVLAVFDLTTGARIHVAMLQPQQSHIAQVALDHAGTTAYAVVQAGHQHKSNQNSYPQLTQLVRVDVATLTELGRIDLGATLSPTLEIAADGKSAVVSTGTVDNGVAYVDLTTFTLKRSLVPGFKTNVATYAPDGSIAAIGEQIVIYRDGVASPPRVTPYSRDGKVRRAVFASPTVLWVGRKNAPFSIDVTTGDSQEYFQYNGAIVQVMGGKLFVGGRGRLQRLDMTGNAELSISTGRIFGHWIGRDPF